MGSLHVCVCQTGVLCSLFDSFQMSVAKKEKHINNNLNKPPMEILSGSPRASVRVFEMQPRAPVWLLEKADRNVIPASRTKTMHVVLQKKTTKTMHSHAILQTQTICCESKQRFNFVSLFYGFLRVLKVLDAKFGIYAKFRFC